MGGDHLKQDIKGSGLGLNIAKNLVEAMGGGRFGWRGNHNKK